MLRFVNRPYLPLLVLCVTVFAFYQSLICSNPTIYWIDAHIRAALDERLIIEQWLPTIQFFVVFASKITSDLSFLRTVLSVLAIGTLVSIYFLAKRISSHLTGLVAFVFLSLNMMFAALATVPYPDVLFMGLTFAVVNLLDEPLFTPRFYIGVFALNLASLTRYEGWLLAALFVVEAAVRSFRASRWDTAFWQTLKIALLCSVAPFAWLSMAVPHGNLANRLWVIFNFSTSTASPTLNDHVLVRMNPEYLSEFFSQYFHLLNWQIRIEFLTMGIVGLLLAIINKTHRPIHVRILTFLILDLCVLVFVQPMEFGNLRQPFLLEGFLILYAAYGLIHGSSCLFRRFSLSTDKPYPLKWAPWFAIISTTLLSVRLIPVVVEFVVASSQETRFVIPYEIGKWLNPRLMEEDTILIIDDTDFYPYALATYMEHPLEEILDDRFETRVIQENLAKAQKAYVIALYSSEDGLSSAETRIMEDLERGLIRSERWAFGAANVWYVSASEIVYSP